MGFTVELKALRRAEHGIGNVSSSVTALPMGFDNNCQIWGGCCEMLQIQHNNYTTRATQHFAVYRCLQADDSTKACHITRAVLRNGLIPSKVPDAGSADLSPKRCFPKAKP